MREGIEVEEGRVETLQTGVLDNAFRTLVYADARLLERLRGKYGDLTRRNDVTILERGQLDTFWDSIQTIFAEEELELPT